MEKILTWYWRSQPLDNRSGADIFDLLFRQTNSIATLLESPGESSLARYSICAGSPRLIKGKLQLWTPSIGQIFPFLRQLLSKSPKKIPENPHLPFTGGWLGWLGYDVAKEIERLPSIRRDTLPFPVAYWYEPEAFAVLDHLQQTLWLASTSIKQLDELENQLESSLSLPSSGNLTKLSFLSSQADYQAAVQKALKYIQAGDIFQANLSLRFQAVTQAEGWDIYRRLQKINPSPFASYWQTPWGVVISCSPERLIQLQGNHAQTRPIAGTRSRGDTIELDQHLSTELITNTKERAEHIMLVDLERNDLGKVCQWGSVQVDELLTIERYSHVIHLVSNISGKLAPSYDAVDLIAALFPGGTITGCPKVRCMEIIEELEPVSRSLFYGSCGYLDYRGNLDLNILIRTLLMVRGEQESLVWGQVGAGIVADSDPEQEWYESRQKSKAQITALQIDTY